MPSLHELQRQFSAAAIFGDPGAAASLGIVAGSLSPAARLGVYRNNILGNYRKVLAATYPVVKRLVGVAFFDAASDQFARAHPSPRGDVNRYGAEFPVFLLSYAPARELAYLADVARLEWAIDQANIASDALPLDFGALAAIDPQMLPDLRLMLHPSAALIASRFPIMRIWQTNQPGYQGDDRIDLCEGGDTLLVLRTSSGIAVERVGVAEHAFLASLAANEMLSLAADRADKLDARFDLAAVLRAHVVNHTIVAFRAPPISNKESRS
jgi:hypothetical protein